MMLCVTGTFFEIFSIYQIKHDKIQMILLDVDIALK